MVDPVKAPNRAEVATTEIGQIYTRVDELVNLMKAEINRLPMANSWSIDLGQSAILDSSPEARAGIRAAIKFDDIPEYKASVSGGRTPQLTVERR